MSKEGLTIKQQRFADKYIETGNATQSYIDAGYKASKREVAESNARKLLGNYSVHLYIMDKMKELQKATIASQEEVLEFLSRGMRGEVKDQFDMDPSFQDRIKCSELLGKKYGLFTEKKDLNAKLDTEIRVMLTDD